MALGAGPADILPLVLRRSLALVGGGIAIGVAVASGLNRLIAGLLATGGGVDVATVSVAGGLILLTAFVACLLPALAAQRLDPVAALKQD
jgi:ABC-type antimicrobial peptide transport system permease subunit